MCVCVLAVNNVGVAYVYPDVLGNVKADVSLSVFLFLFFLLCFEWVCVCAVCMCLYVCVFLCMCCVYVCLCVCVWFTVVVQHHPCQQPSSGTGELVNAMVSDVLEINLNVTFLKL